MNFQSALLKVCGPMACMWAKLIDNNLLSDPNATVNVHIVLNNIQCTIVLLGTQMRYPNCGTPRSWQLLTHLLSSDGSTTALFCNKHAEDYNSPLFKDRVLGFTLNTKTIMVALPATKMNGIQSDVLQNATVSLKVLSQLLGKLVATKPAVFRAPLHYQALQHLKISMMISG